MDKPECACGASCRCSAPVKVQEVDPVFLLLATLFCLLSHQHAHPSTARHVFVHQQVSSPIFTCLNVTQWTTSTTSLPHIHLRSNLTLFATQCHACLDSPSISNPSIAALSAQMLQQHTDQDRHAAGVVKNITLDAKVRCSSRKRQQSEWAGVQ